MRSVFRYIAAICLSVCALSGCKEQEISEPVTVTLNRELVSSLEVGEELTLYADVRPEGSDVSLVWESSDENVAVVNDGGTVTGVSAGEAEITVRAGESSAGCKVVVTARKPDNVRIVPEELELTVGADRKLEVVFVPEDAVAEDMIWASSDKTIVSVDQSGNVKGLKEGESVISVKCMNGLVAAACKVTVTLEETVVNAVEIKLDKTSIELNIGETAYLSTTYIPTDAYVDDLEWKSSDPETVTVDNGKLLAVRQGSAVITASCYGGVLKASCEVTVNEPEDVSDDLISVALMAEGNASDVQVGLPLKLNAVYTPADAEPKNVVWTVDNSSYASVDQSGIVTGVTALKQDDEWSNVTVTVVADSKAAYLTLRVVPRQPDDLSINLPEGPVKVGESWDLNPRLIPEELNGKFPLDLTMGSPVSDGVFRSAKPGNIGFGFYISDLCEDIVYRFVKYYSINVEPYWVESVSLPSSYEMEVGESLTLTPSFTSDVPGVEPTYKDVKWSSSDPTVASVDDNGGISAISSGTVEITATTSSEWSVPEGTMHKSAVCTLTVTDVASTSAQVGDYYYSDGTWSSNLNADKTIVGVVFAKVDATTSDALLARDYPECTNGLVVALDEYADQDFGSVSTYYGHGYYSDLGYDANLLVDTAKPNGYGNTLAHRAFNASKPDYCTLFNETDGLVSVHAAAVPAPTTASAWYVPSFMEMDILNKNRETVNASLTAAGGIPVAEPYEREDSWIEDHVSDMYWTSTIYGVLYQNGNTYDHFKYPYDISRGGWSSVQQSNGRFKVRVILAF